MFKLEYTLPQVSSENFDKLFCELQTCSTELCNNTVQY